jgi:hypothetical protein
MQKNLPVVVLCVCWLLASACQKKDILSCGDPKASNSSKKTGDPAALKNGGGPYVLNMVIQLSGDEEVPAVSTPTKGLAHLRLTADKKLYSKVIIQKLEDGDVLRFAHVHSGAAGVNGPIRIFLCHTAEDFGENIVTDLTDEQYNFLLNTPVYVNAHSNFSPPGIVRGQIR